MPGHEVITLNDVFTQHLAHLKVDNSFAQRVYSYQVGYLNKRQEYLDFYGSNLIGVHVIRYTDADILKFYREVLNIDFVALERDIRKVTTIEHEFKVSGDVFNLTLFYLLHCAYTSTYLVENKRMRVAYDISLIFYFRCIAALQSDYFQFPADPKIAQAAYAALSLKFLIKKLGSWYKVVDYRAKALATKESKWYKSLILFNDDYETVQAINDSQGAIRSMYKYYYAVFRNVHSAGESIKTTASTMIDMEGVEKVREKVHSVEKYINFIRTAVIDPPTFVRQDLMEVIVNINTNTSMKTLSTALTWISENYNNVKWHMVIDEYLTLIITHSFHLLQETGASRIRDYPSLLNNLKNLYLSTRSNDPELMKIRDVGEKIIKASIGNTNRSLMMATRTSTILYITLRALATPQT